MKVEQATQQYERCLAQQIPFVEESLALKPAAMKRDAFSLLRATVYRWMQIGPQACAAVVEARGAGDWRSPGRKLDLA